MSGVIIHTTITSRESWSPAYTSDRDGESMVPDPAGVARHGTTSGSTARPCSSPTPPAPAACDTRPSAPAAAVRPTIFALKFAIAYVSVSPRAPATLAARLAFDPPDAPPHDAARRHLEGCPLECRGRQRFSAPRERR